jgi:SAM-dependent methyltransferase
MECIVCGNGTRSYPAVIGGFIAELALQTAPEATDLRECRACGLRFFERRYSDEEMHRLYDAYRGEEYFAIRHRHEPWYTRKLNSMTTATTAVIAQRKAGIAALMARHCPNAQSVLDYGGDRGQFIPEHVKEKYVFDYADVDPVPNVIKLDGLGARQFDCVLVLNVLEHVSDPVAEMHKISGLLATGGTLIISVPEEYPAILPGYASLARLVRVFALRSRVAAIGVDLFSKVMKFKFNMFPPLSLASQSEHLSFFTTRSLAELAKSGKIVEAGFEAEPDGVFRRSLFLVAQF